MHNALLRPLSGTRSTGHGLSPFVYATTVDICFCFTGWITPPQCARIAVSKATAAALSRRETRFFQDLINEVNQAFITAPVDGLIEGDVPIVLQDTVVGAIGVSGAKSADDAAIARAGIAAMLAA